MGEICYDVLIVDDDPATLRLVSRIVSKAHHRTRCVSDGCQAMAEIRKRCPDLVISDWEMPGLDGLALCQAIRLEPLPKYVGVILLTAHSAEEEMVQGLDAGADDFICKPIRPAVLMARFSATTRILEMERRLREASERDPLTGLLNRRTLHERLAWALDRSSNHAVPLSCVMFDLDFFKHVNDTYGHAAGDAVLKAVADLVKRHVQGDVACRYGGEEFCVILSEMDESDAVAWAERVRQAIARLSVSVQDHIVRVSSSFGVAQRTDGITGPESLLCLADDGLAVAKQTGRNRVVPYSSIDNPPQMFTDSTSLVPLSNVLAKDIMFPADLCPHASDTVAYVVDLLLRLRLTSVPVIDDQGYLAGVVSEIDLARGAISGHGWWDPIQDLLAGEVVTFDEENNAKEVFDFLSRTSLRRIVVLRDGKPTGVISRACLVRWFRNWFALHEYPPKGQSVKRHLQQQSSRVLASVEQRVAELRTGLKGNAADPLPAIVTQATQLQELADELLGVTSTECGIGTF